MNLVFKLRMHVVKYSEPIVQHKYIIQLLQMYEHIFYIS